MKFLTLNKNKSFLSKMALKTWYGKKVFFYNENP